MLINAIEPEENRIAILEDNALEEFYIERHSRLQSVGNIYKGRVVNIEPSIQAAFVDLGLKRNGFLYVADVMPNLAADKKLQNNNRSETQKCPETQRHKTKIKSILSKGQSIIVQMTKEGIGEKGPCLTTYISLPGRYLVLMPNAKRNGVSRRITDEGERKRLKKLLEGLEIPPNMGVIIRTAGLNQTKRELNRDLRYLYKLWDVVSKRIKEDNVPAAIYQESDLVIRAIRDIFSTDIDEIIIDSQEVYKRSREFLRQVMPKYEKKVKLFKETEPLFHKFNIESELEKINNKEITLPGGGSIIIEQTEALVAIDVNSKKFKEEDNPEETAFKTNCEAADEIARQIRLRDMGGEIVIDFIDMREENHIRKVEKRFAGVLKRDRARITVLKMSKFCITEMTRQRIRSNIRDVLFVNCPHCAGTGFVKSTESIGLDILRMAKFAVHKNDIKTIEVYANEKVVQYLQNQKRGEIVRMEDAFNKEIIIGKYSGSDQDTIKIKYFSSNNQPVKI